MTTTTVDSRLSSRITMTGVVRSEWVKFRSLRSSWAAVATSVGLVVGLAVVVTLIAAGQPHSSGLPDRVATRAELGAILAQLSFGVLAVLVVAGEYGHGTIRNSLAAVPRRLPVLWAKVAVVGAVTFTAAIVSSFGGFLLAQVLWQAHSRAPVSVGDDHVLRILFGTAAYLTGTALVALAIGALLRRPAAGITVTIGLLFGLPTVMQALPGRIGDAGEF